MSKRDEDEWEEEVSVNCMGVLNGIGAVLQGMVERKSGHIINMCDPANLTCVSAHRDHTQHF